MKASMGPIGKSVEDCVYMLKCIFNADLRHQDPTINRKPWDDNYKSKGKLNIGY